MKPEKNGHWSLFVQAIKMKNAINKQRNTKFQQCSPEMATSSLTDSVCINVFKGFDLEAHT